MRKIGARIITVIMIAVMAFQFAACKPSKYYNSQDIRDALDKGTDIVGTEVSFVIEDKTSANMYIEQHDPGLDYFYESGRVYFAIDGYDARRTYWHGTSVGDTISGTVNQVIPVETEFMGDTVTSYVVHITASYHTNG